jgi:hypothetical protein
MLSTREEQARVYDRSATRYARPCLLLTRGCSGSARWGFPTGVPEEKALSKSFPLAYVAMIPRAFLEPQLMPVRDVFECLPRKALEIAAAEGARIHVLDPGERYCDASGALRRLGVGVDQWPVPPAGLFVLEERTMYLREIGPMSVAHEFGHALDCALGGGVYRSGYDVEIREAFSEAKEFVTPYAAAGLDEYFAEAFRAYVEVNESDSPWPQVTRAGLALHAPRMAALFEREIGQAGRVAA